MNSSCWPKLPGLPGLPGSVTRAARQYCTAAAAS
jgi:hypothetical protein